MKPRLAAALRGVRRLVPGSLTGRLVATAVALVALVCILIGVATTLAMRGTLISRLDGDIQDASASIVVRPTGVDTRSVAPGTLIYFVGAAAADGASGGIVGYQPGVVQAVSTGALDRIKGIQIDDRPHDVDIEGFGAYRLVAQQVSTPYGTVTKVVGLPMTDLNATLRRLILWELGLTILGVIVAAGAGLLLVDRQLRPLRQVAATAHEVADLPLASGEVGAIARVPTTLTDETTEVGQVGSALNTLLEHVESSLAARHRSEQQVRQFVADASHELRTPLTTIRGYADLARSRPGDAVASETALAKVQEESGRMTALVEDLLLLARLDQGRPLADAEVDLTRLLLESVSDARVVDHDRTWRLELPHGADPEQPVVVHGDEQRLHQVVANLLSNARAYTPAGTTVTVTVLADGFVVHDDGPGFPAELVPVAFERFTRGDAGRQRENGNASGAGLGLSLVKAIVESHGGTVALTSVPGDTAITVRLPH